VIFVITGLSTTNRLQMALGIIDINYDFTNTAFTWDVSTPSFSATSADIQLYVNGTNIVT
jgi:hypothetical protein